MLTKAGSITYRFHGDDNLVIGHHYSDRSCKFLKNDWNVQWRKYQYMTSELSLHTCEQVGEHSFTSRDVSDTPELSSLMHTYAARLGFEDINSCYETNRISDRHTATNATFVEAIIVDALSCRFIGGEYRMYNCDSGVPIVDVFSGRTCETKIRSYPLSHRCSGNDDPDIAPYSFWSCAHRGIVLPIFIDDGETNSLSQDMHIPSVVYLVIILVYLLSSILKTFTQKSMLSEPMWVPQSQLKRISSLRKPQTVNVVTSKSSRLQDALAQTEVEVIQLQEELSAAVDEANDLREELDSIKGENASLKIELSEQSTTIDKMNKKLAAGLLDVYRFQQQLTSREDDLKNAKKKLLSLGVDLGVSQETESLEHDILVAQHGKKKNSEVVVADDGDLVVMDESNVQAVEASRETMKPLSPIKADGSEQVTESETQNTAPSDPKGTQEGDELKHRCDEEQQVCVNISFTSKSIFLHTVEFGSQDEETLGKQVVEQGN